MNSGLCRVRHALVAEDAADLEHPLHAADDQPLEVQLERDAQVEVEVERVVVGDERPGVGAAGLDVQHRRLDLDEAALVQRAAEAGDHRVADLEGAPRLVVDDQVGVALTEAGVGVGEPVPLVGQRPDGLGQQFDLLDLHRQLALAGGHDGAVDADPVAEVEFLDARRTPRRRSRPSTRTAGSSPERSRIVAKINLPGSRSSMTRPATRTRSSVSVPASRPPHVDRTSASVCERSKRYGYGSVPAARIPSTRPSRRARSAARPLPVAARPSAALVGVVDRSCHLPRWQHGSEFSPPRPYPVPRRRVLAAERRRRLDDHDRARATSDGPVVLRRRGPALDAGRRRRARPLRRSCPAPRRPPGRCDCGHP